MSIPNNVPPGEYIPIREPPQRNPRITVVENVYHQQPDEPPTELSHRYGYDLLHDEQLYQRKCKVGQDWEPLDTGWIEHPGTIIIENLEGKHLPENLPKDKKLELQEKCLVLSFGGKISQGFLVHARRSIRFQPCGMEHLQICAIKGTVKFLLTVVSQ